jgi:hypothetical protein
MAQLAIAAAGAYVGGAALGTGVVAFGMTGTAIGWAVGSYVGGMLFGPKLPDGPRIQDKKVTVSTYGTEIPRLYGTARLAGNVIWSTDLQERAKKEGGKGGPTYTTYSYSVSCAVSVCLGPITGVRKIWADSLLIYDASIENDGPQRNFSASAFRVYLGTESQTVDPTIQAAMGNTPAYRGQAYVVFENLELEKFGNRIPNFTFEAINGNQEPRTWRDFLDDDVFDRYSTNGHAEVDPVTGYIWVSRTDQAATLEVIDPATRTVIASMTGRGSGAYKTFCFVTFIDPITQLPTRLVFTTNSDYIPGTLDQYIDVWSADTYSLVIESTTARYGLLNLDQNFCFYNPARQEVYTGSTRGGATQLNYYSITSTSVTPNGAPDTGHFNSEGGYIEQANLMYIGDGKTFTFYEATTMSKIGEINLSSFSFNIGAQPKIAYDPTRNRILWVSNAGYVMIDVGSLSIIQQGSFSSGFGLGTIVYHAPNDTYVASYDVPLGLLTPKIFEYDAETFTLLQEIEETGLTGDLPQLISLPYYDDRVFTFSSTIGTQLYIKPALSVATIPLDQVVLAESAIVDLDSSKIDVTDLAGETVYGYAVTSAGTIRGSLEPLMIAYQFDAVESNGKIKFVLRKNAPTVVIDDEDIAYHDFGTETPDTLPVTRADEIELPRSVTVKYSNPSADYQISSQASYRLSGNTKNDLMIELPVVMYDQQAKDIADIALYSAWAARSKAQVQTSIKYANVEPTDLVLVQGNLIRVTSKELRGNIVALNGEFENGQIYTQNSIAPSAFPVGQTFGILGNTNLVFLDIPMLRDQDNNSGFYVAASGFGQVWNGCLLFKSVDGGTSWVEIAQIFNRAVIGAVQEALPAFEQNIIDNINAITIVLKPNDELNNTNIEGLLNQSNAAIIGNEIIQFRTATQIAENKYLLSGLLRGRRGTSTQGHIAGERFVLLEESSVIRVLTDSSETGVQRSYRAVSIGKTLDSAPNLSFTNTDNCLECYSPVKLAGGRDSAGNLRISWVRRTRIAGGWRNFSDVPVGEESESYSVEIYDNGTLVRTINSTTTNATYSAADQTTDFGAPQSSVDVVVYQNSATNGAGFTISGSV